MSTYENDSANDDLEEIKRQEMALLMGFLTEKQFGMLAKITPSTLETWRRTGRGPTHTRLGNAVFYGLDEVKRHLESSKKTENRGSIRRAIASA